MSLTAVCPGSFDPITLGHLDVIERAAARFDRLIVAVLDNPEKATGLFSGAERVELIRETVEGVPGVEVDRFSGLLVDYCQQRGAEVICKGLRAVSDFEFEVQMAQMNRQVGGVETMFLATSPQYSHLSSSLIKQVARGGGALDGLVPEPVARALRERVG